MKDLFKTNWYFVNYMYWWNLSKAISLVTGKLSIKTMVRACASFEKFYAMMKNKGFGNDLKDLADEWAWFRSQYVN